MKTDHGTLNIPNDPTPWVIVRPNDDKTWCVLWLQGWTSTIEGHLDGITRMAQASDISFAMLDYAGHGTHAVPLEDSTRSGQLTECLAAYDELVHQGYQHIIVIGGSFGGYMAALLTGKRKPAAVILRAPAIYNGNEFTLPHRETARWDEQSDDDKAFRLEVTKDSQLDELAAIGAYDGPVWVMEHELDTVVPQNVPRAYFETANHGNYILVQNTEHSPKTMAHPEKHFAYIEHLLVSIVSAIPLTPTKQQ